MMTVDEKAVTVTLIVKGLKKEERGRERLAVAGQKMPAKTSAGP